ncbi:hypothetical protein TNCT_357611 [Trichonephila clavata]|uniref:Transmembrane protein n=1 Tax=Trichonephila clavata TaxID=2740835 RepID=A0A8X6HY70_TRICU|nr:hypothetical protein TNCT_357611 [Trichonephila clavata]
MSSGTGFTYRDLVIETFRRCYRHGAHDAVWWASRDLWVILLYGRGAFSCWWLVQGIVCCIVFFPTLLKSSFAFFLSESRGAPLLSASGMKQSQCFESMTVRDIGHRIVQLWYQVK